MSKEILINVSEGEECRIALLEDGKLEELYMERTSSTSHVGNIYKGRVTNVEPSIQAAFIDFGLGRNGFLHISDLMPTYFGKKGEDVVETVGRKMARRDRPPIQRCLRRGDEITVQIIKEGIGTKGPTLSTYLSIPGRILVMMPGMGKMGVSRKIEDDEERRRLRQILDGLKPPKGVGFIIRTAGVGKTKAEIERDLKYLTRLWEQIEKKSKEPSPVELYTEGDLVTRTVRDVFTADIDRIVVDSKDVAKRVRDVIKLANPRTKNKVELYEDPVPLFHKADIERDIEMMYSRHVPLPSGGSLVIDSTEAIVAIDVNSGKFREHADAETTAFKTDLEAADEIPRQLRLRDLGGVIICDFIDLRFERHRRELEHRLHENLKKDRAKTKFLHMSQFGIIEMTRQRMRPSLKRSIYFDCPHCKGAGLVKTPESMSLDAMRRLAIALNDQRVARAELGVCPDVAFYLQNRKRKQLTELEVELKKRVVVRSDSSLGLDEMRIDLFDSRDAAVIIPELGLIQSQPPHTSQLEAGKHRGGRPGARFDDRRNQRRQPPRQQHAQLPTRREEPDEDRYDLDEVEDAVDRREEDGGEESDALHAAPPQAPAINNEAAGESVDQSEDFDRQPTGSYEPGQGEGEGEGSRRRRRRRGRRGRGRNRNDGGNGGNAGSSNTASGGRQQGGFFQPPGGVFENQAHDVIETDDEEESSERQPEAASHDEHEDDAEDSIGNRRDDDRDEPRGNDRSRGGGRNLQRGGGFRGRSDARQNNRSRGPQPSSRLPAPAPRPQKIDQAVESSDADDAEDNDDAGDSIGNVIDIPSAEPGEEGQPKRRRRRRGGRRHRRRKENAMNGDSPAASPQDVGTTKIVDADVPTARISTADRHLVSDEPIDPPPISRPRSYRDLDAIPDDLD